MKTITELAEEYVEEGPESAFTDEDMPMYLKRAYLAGAKAACELGSLTLAESSQYTMAIAVLRAQTPEDESRFKLTADVLLEASKTIAELIPES